MNREQNETDENIIENTIETIKTVENPAMQADLLAVMSILAGEKFTSELVKKYVRRDMLMNSPIYNTEREWYSCFIMNLQKVIYYFLYLYKLHKAYS